MSQKLLFARKTLKIKEKVNQAIDVFKLFIFQIFIFNCNIRLLNKDTRVSDNKNSLKPYCPFYLFIIIVTKHLYIKSKFKIAVILYFVH